MTATAAKLEIDNSQEIIVHLNAVLRYKLTAINQYFLHARMMKHSGYMKLADCEYKESIEQMRYSDKLVERVLALGGIPNLQDLGKLSIGEKIDEILRCDLKLQNDYKQEIQNTLAVCKDSGDGASAEILSQIENNQAVHIKFISEQLNLIDSMGLPAYLKSQS